MPTMPSAHASRAGHHTVSRRESARCVGDAVSGLTSRRGVIATPETACPAELAGQRSERSLGILGIAERSAETQCLLQRAACLGGVSLLHVSEAEVIVRDRIAGGLLNCLAQSGH